MFKLYYEYDSELNFGTLVTFLNVISLLKNEMCGSYSAYVVEERCIQGFDEET